MSEPSLVVRVRAAGAGTTELLSPSVGIFIPSVAEGDLVAAGQPIGAIDVLGLRRPLRVPNDVAGRVSHRLGQNRTRVPVQYGDALLTVSATAGTSVSERPPERAGKGSALSFPAPMSGRFYCRPSPTEPPFVEVGDTVTTGQTVGLLEVMKTFNRLVYQGDAVPAEATVVEIVPADGDDIVRGEAILLLSSPDGD